jgi:hypothetical protein
MPSVYTAARLDVNIQRCRVPAAQALKLALQQQPEFAAFADRVLAVVSPPDHAPPPPNPTVAAIRELLSQRC